jgi:photosystem II stability/assembly factor-like uncharacterized protein
MKKIFLSFFLIATLTATHGQCDSLFFRNAATFIYDMLLIDSSKIIGVGDNGYIIKSINGGKSWKNIPTFQPYMLRSIYASTDSVLYAVGAWKTVLKSEDQGETWYPLIAKVSGFTSATVFFNDVFFFNKDNGFIVGDESRLVRTNDGGRTWKDTTFAMQSSSRINSVTFVNDTLGFICGGSNAMFRTKNGGSTWEPINLDFLGFNRDIKKVRFLDHLNGFAVGNNGIFIRTTDGGNTWTSAGLPTGTSGIFFDVLFLNTQTGFIAGDGTVLKTIDGGNTWSIPSALVVSSCYTIATDPTKTKIAIAGGGSSGDPLGYNGRSIITTIDTGTTFQKHSANRKIDYHDVFFINDSTGYITGVSGNTFKTTDYGETWQPLQNIPAFSGANPAKNIFFINEQVGYGATDRIYKTSSGGNSWDLVSTPDGQLQFNTRRMYFFDQATGVVMENYSMYKTVNSGNTWTPVLTSPSSFGDLCFTPNGKGYTVGFNGTMFVSQNQGDTWSPFNLNTSSYLTSVYFFNNDLGFIGTDDSTLFKTIDGGSTWTMINARPGAMMRSFFFLNDTMGYMIRNNTGSPGAIYKTKNGGVTWTAAIGGSESLSRLSGWHNVYTAGNSGYIVKTDKPKRPEIPGYIYDSAGLYCTNSQSYFTTGLLTGVNYTWSLSGGGTTMFNQNIDTVNWNTAGNHNLSVTLSNVCGSGPTRQITLTVYQAPAITSQPVSKKVCPGATATFSVTATGHSPKFQWKKNAVDIVGAINSSFTIVSVAISDAGNYTVVITDTCGSLTSSIASLTILPSDSCVTAVRPVDNPLSGVFLMPNIVSNHTVLKVVARKTVKVNWVVFDMNGRLIAKFTNQPVYGDNYYDLLFERLARGMYIIRGSNGNSHLWYVKFIKQ